ncbi:formyltransferase family protein [Acinetobacter baumannii]
MEHNIPVYQPASPKLQLKKATSSSTRTCCFRALMSAVVAAYGLFFHKLCSIHLNMAVLNIHGSLLPRWRGAAPDSACNCNQVTTKLVSPSCKLAAGLDTGDMMSQNYCPITSEDTSATLYDKLAAQGATAICAVRESEETLQKIFGRTRSSRRKLNGLCS